MSFKLAVKRWLFFAAGGGPKPTTISLIDLHKCYELVLTDLDPKAMASLADLKRRVTHLDAFDFDQMASLRRAKERLAYKLVVVFVLLQNIARAFCVLGQNGDVFSMGHVRLANDALDHCSRYRDMCNEYVPGKKVGVEKISREIVHWKTVSKKLESIERVTKAFSGQDIFYLGLE
jgi:Fe-S-cluster formation regulator IscX/YfhJ